MTVKTGRKIPLLDRRSRLSSASWRNASEQSQAHSLENLAPVRNELDFF